MKPDKTNKFSTNHGGVAAVVNAGFELLPLHIAKQSIHFEHICVRISSKARSVIVLVVYGTGYASCGFWDDFSKIINTLSTYNEKVIILEDFNFHLEQADDTLTQNFSNLLTLHNFHLFIDQQTHKLGGWLDVVACKQKFKMKYYETDISDQKLLIWKCLLTKPSPIYIELIVRQWKLLDNESFAHEVENSSIASATNLDVDSALQLYNSTLSIIFDKMLPIKTIRIHQRSSHPWFEQECHDIKRLKRKLECKYTKNKCKVDLGAWVNRKQIYRRLCRQRKKEYWNAKLMDPKSKSSNTWKFLNKISRRGKKSAAHVNAQEYHFYLLEKIETAKISIQSSEAPKFSKCNENLSLKGFNEVTLDELLYANQKLQNKQCEHDPIPT